MHNDKEPIPSGLPRSGLFALYGESMTMTVDSSDTEKRVEAPAPAAQQEAAPCAVTRKGTRSPMRYPQRVLLRALLTLGILWIMFGFILGVTTAPNNDMYSRIDAGDLVLYYQLDKNVQAQDVVALRKNGTDSVCRVVAVEGDTVEVTAEENLIINGSTMIEANIFYPTPMYEGFVDYPLTLGEGECFVLADRRNGGEDSRYFGPVSRNEISGTVVTVVRRSNL